MSLWEVLLLSIALGADLFSVAVPIGMQGLEKERIFFSSVVFACFHIFMIWAGYFFGHLLGDVLTAQASAFGATILILLGCNMLWEQKQGKEMRSCRLRGGALVSLAVSVSLDAFVAGIGLGILEVNLLFFSLILGLTIFVISFCGFTLGDKLGAFVGRYAPVLGGLLLAAFGMQTLLRVFWLK
ncbi:MAG: manganese efflux pump [Sporomusaceae bacterium]|nr:manganese efflux pump [Sporomusaceae bacterium]